MELKLITIPTQSLFVSMGICIIMVRLGVVHITYFMSCIWSHRVMLGWVKFHLPTAGASGRLVNRGSACRTFSTYRPYLLYQNRQALYIHRAELVIRRNRLTMNRRSASNGLIIARKIGRMSIQMKSHQNQKQVWMAPRMMTNTLFLVSMKYWRGKGY